MDYGYKFELLLNDYLGRPDYVTYANNWTDNNERTALLFTACIIEYDKSESGSEVEKKLSFFMKELFNDQDDKKISIDCLLFLKGLKE